MADGFSSTRLPTAPLTQLLRDHGATPPPPIRGPASFYIEAELKARLMDLAVDATAALGYKISTSEIAEALLWSAVKQLESERSNG